MKASLIVFVEVMKERSTTLNRRPFGMETLATQICQYASSEQLAPTAPATLLMSLFGFGQCY